jgi:cell division septum initiation protein DivIVA
LASFPTARCQTKVAGAFADIDAAASREIQMTEAQFKAQIAAQEQQAKNNQQIALAQINQQTAANNQAAQTERVELEANASAQRAALRSGDPIQVAAASVTSGDIDWINALSTAAQIIF